MKKSFLLGLAAMLLPLTAWAQADFTVTVTPKTDKTFEYAGDETKNNVEVKVTVKFAGDEQAETLTENTHFKVVSYHNSTTNEDVLRNAGDYTVTIQGLEAYRGYAIPAGEFTITRAELTDLTFSAGEKEYGATLAEANLSGAINITAANGLLTGQTDQDAELKNALSCLTLNFVNGSEKVGDNNIVTIKGLEDSENPSNYFYKGEGAPIYLKITPKVLKATLAEASSVYTAEEIALADLTPMINSEDIVGEDVVTVAFTSVKDSKTIKNVDKYTLVAELGGADAGNYTLADDGEVSYSITRAELKIEKADNEELKKTYDGTVGLEGSKDLTSLYKVSSETVEGVSFESLGLSMQVEATVAAGMNKGKYLVHPNNGVKNLGTALYVTPEDEIKGETELSNYTISYEREKLQFEIEAKTVKYYFIGTGTKYNGTEIESLNTGDYSIDFVEGYKFVGEETFTTAPTAKFDLAEGDVVKNAKKYTLTEDQKAAVSDNYTVEFVKTIEGKDINVFEVSPIKMTIKAVDQTFSFEDYKALDEAEIAKWVDSNSLVSISSTPKVTDDVKEMRKNHITLTLEDFDEAEAAEVDENVISGKKKITVHVTEQTAEAVEANPVLGNYTFILKDGTLTIETVDEPLVLDGSEDEVEEGEETIMEKLTRLDGATVYEIQVKNLLNFVDDEYDYNENITIKPEQWYTLVLPFDVDVRDLSYLFGYAIVNVPNTDNGDGQARFKLTMQTVPANTLMAFKVDKEIVWNADKTVKFTNKKIVAPTGEWATDKAGNQFIGVYKKMAIIDADDWYLWPEDGKFYSAYDVYEYNEVGYNIYPLNGYVHFDSSVPVAARTISMENPDGSTTAINAITGKVINNNAEGWYTIGGIKLNGEPTQKGIYINNGKKVVIK